MPDEFILTDADLQFNPNLPKNFVEILSDLSNKYNCSKIGFALDLSDYDKMYQSSYVCLVENYKNLTIYEWEVRFWENRLPDDMYELYKADIDTTFSLINKKNAQNAKSLRIAGDFVAKHIPWYVENPILNAQELDTLYSYNSSISTTANMYKNYSSRK
jgi:hypothetical protein